ncbi:MAG TPA: site-2 protease family protein [Tepidisphaeraceae bacterium]|nr:site-2 protease family protein [Tepidisphaeraceae bacterium]
MLAAVDFSSSLTWAIFIAWIMSVVLHELAHGIVGYLGGDYTVRERGGLTLNPIQYIDPVFSLLVPAVIFLIGGVPLPGGVTYIRMDLIPRRIWQAAVSAAGPVMNFLIFLACALPLHPKLGWIEPHPVDGQWSNAVLFLGAFAWLQMLAVLFNLIPIPGLDGFGVIYPFMDERSKETLGNPQVRNTLIVIWFMILWRVPGLFQIFHNAVSKTLLALGFDGELIGFFGHAYNVALFGHRAS